MCYLGMSLKASRCELSRRIRVSDENLKLLTDESELIKCLSKSMEVESAAILVIAPSENFILLLSVIILPLSKFTPVTA